MLTGFFMLALTLGGLRFAVESDTMTSILIPFVVVSAGIGGLVGVLVRWNPWLMCLLGIMVLGLGTSCCWTLNFMYDNRVLLPY